MRLERGEFKKKTDIRGLGRRALRSRHNGAGEEGTKRVFNNEKNDIMRVRWRV